MNNWGNPLRKRADLTPLVGPQNAFTNMFTNLDALIFFACPVPLSATLPHQVAILVLVFGIAESVLAHKGKRTFYNPGLASALLYLLPLSVWAGTWLAENPARVGQAWGGIGLVAFVIVGLILVPFLISIRVKSERLSFRPDEAGYFRRWAE